MSGIFISYRRQDSEDITGRIRERLAGAFGGSSVFKDTQSIPQGSEFPVVLAERINDASAALIIIGPTWLSIAEKGRQRLFRAGDYVRAEVEAALHKPGLLVLPVLVRNAKMPQRNDYRKVSRVLLTAMRSWCAAIQILTMTSLSLLMRSRG